MKRVIFLFICTISLSAQAQIGLMNQYHFNYLAINPALAGENGPFAIKAVVGNQFNGNLRFNQLSHVLVVDGQLYNKTGLAFQSNSDNYGNSSGNNFALSLAKGIEAGNLKLKGGINAGISVLPTYQLVSSTPQTSFNAGFGIFSSYRNLFIGLSKPSLYVSKNDLSLGQPLFLNTGFFTDNEDGLSLNANFLWSNLKSKNNYDFNLKLWFDKQLAVAGSYRINNIYSYYSKKKSFIPSIEYKVTKDLLFGLAYNNNALRYTNASGQQNLKLNGIFQFYIRYNKEDRAGDGWYHNQF